MSREKDEHSAVGEGISGASSSGRNDAGGAHDSVLFALDELHKLENERACEEAARHERQRAQAEARRAEELRLAEEEHCRRVAEAEARLRIDGEIQRRDAEAKARIAALRAELAAVQCSREAFHQRLIEAHSQTCEAVTAAAPSARRWKLAFASTFTIATVLIALLLLERPRSTAPCAPRQPIPSAFTRSEGNYESRHLRVKPPAQRQPAGGSEASDKPSLVSRPLRQSNHADGPVQAGKGRLSKKQPRTSVRDHGLGELDECGDDPTCGIDDENASYKKRPAGRRRRK